MDFSLTGAQLRTRRPIKEKASVSIVLYEPHGDLEKYQGQESIKLSGRIVWQRPDGETFQCGVAYDPFTTSNACRCRSASNTSAKTPASDQANKLHWSPTDQAINQNRCCRALAGLLNLDHKTGEGFLAAHQHLVRNTGWNMGHIAGTQFLACPSFNGSAANFSCADGPGSHNVSTGDQGCVAIEHAKQIREILMQLGLSIARAEGKHDCMLRILPQRFACLSVAKFGELSQMSGALHQHRARPVVEMRRLLLSAAFRQWDFLLRREQFP